MYEIFFYEDAHGNCKLGELVDALEGQTDKGDKDARIQLERLYRAIGRLERLGTRAGEDWTKNIEGDLWELRPGKNRVFFFFLRRNQIYLLHSFRKKTQKTPKKEIRQALKEMEDCKQLHEHREGE